MCLHHLVGSSIPYGVFLCLIPHDGMVKIEWGFISNYLSEQVQAVKLNLSKCSELRGNQKKRQGKVLPVYADFCQRAELPVARSGQQMPLATRQGCFVAVVPPLPTKRVSRLFLLALCPCHVLLETPGEQNRRKCKKKWQKCQMCCGHCPIVLRVQ